MATPITRSKAIENYTLSNIMTRSRTKSVSAHKIPATTTTASVHTPKPRVQRRRQALIVAHLLFVDNAVDDVLARDIADAAEVPVFVKEAAAAAAANLVVLPPPEAHKMAVAIEQQVQTPVMVEKRNRLRKSTSVDHSKRFSYSYNSKQEPQLEASAFFRRKMYDLSNTVLKK